jgi:xylan 1,4-beta-xylosidase
MPSSLRNLATAALSTALLTLPAALAASTIADAQQTIVIDTNAPAHAFPHFWELGFGSGRAALAMRQSYRDDLEAVHAITGFQYVRFHAILHDELGVYTEDEHGNAIHNFTYVDQIYDGLLARGVKPIVEISFMPKKLAFNPDALHPFWYKQNVSPPKSMDKWDALLTDLMQHLVARYGIDEVSTWYFEVWNEPNIDFWNGIPRDESYYDLYAHTARAIKGVSPRLRVGGPATAAAAWIPEFLAYTHEHNVPVDFVSTHGYDDEPVERLLGKDQPLRDKDIREEDRTCAAAAHVQQQIEHSATPNLPLLWTEWNVPGRDELRDTPYVGPALAEAIRTCDGHTRLLSYWTFSDVFEEGGVPLHPFEGQFGLRATGGINKPSFYDFALLHQLGDQRLANKADDVIVTRRSDGSLAIAVWNLNEVGKPPAPKSIHLRFTGVQRNAAVAMQLVDDTHSNTQALYAAMGKPQYPSPAQVRELNEHSALSPPQPRHLDGDTLTLNLGTNALVLLRIAR